MIISKFSQRDDGNRFCVEAEVEFEAQVRSERIFYSVPSAQASWIAPQPDAFLVGAVMAAMWLGERRVKIEAAIDPQLAARLVLAMRLMAHWWSSKLAPVKIEAEGPHASTLVAGDRATCIFLSGGVDSLAALRWNTLQYPVGDPRRVTVAFFVYGLDVGDPNQPDRHDVFEAGNEALAKVCRGLDVELVPVHTSLRRLAPDNRFYAEWQFGSLLASIAHVAGHRLNRAITASDNVLEFLGPHGSHPWLNNYFCSDTLDISSGDTEQFSRLQRVRMLAQWPEAMEALRVCWTMKNIPEGALNCGYCSKCLRTMLELVACGALSSAPTFPVKEVDSKMVNLIHIDNKLALEYFEELVDPLRSIGREDLASAVQWKLHKWWVYEVFGLNRLRPIAKRVLNASGLLSGRDQGGRPVATIRPGR